MQGSAGWHALPRRSRGWAWASRPYLPTCSPAAARRESMPTGCRWRNARCRRRCARPATRPPLRQVAPRRIRARLSADPARLRPSIRPLLRRDRLLHAQPRRRLRLAPRRPSLPRRRLQHAPACQRSRAPASASSRPDKPLFLYVPFNAVHAPHQVPDEVHGALRQPAGAAPHLRRHGGRDGRGHRPDPRRLDEKGLARRTRSSSSPATTAGPTPAASPATARSAPARARSTRRRARLRLRRLARPHPAGHRRQPAAPRRGLVSDAPETGRASLDQKLPLDGRDIWPTITEGKPSPHDEILLNTEAHRGAIRVGDWKLGARPPRREGAA